MDSIFSSLLRNLKIEPSPVPSRTWDSIPTESGEARSADPSKKCRDPIYESSSISESALLRLVVNALLGIKSSLIEIDKLSAESLSTAADRTFDRVPTLWCRSMSTVALGKILKCISHSGLLVFFIERFVNFYLEVIQEPNGGNMGEEEECNIRGRNKISYSPTQLAGKLADDNELWLHAPYSLVNQSFAVAVRKVLQGYRCALRTLMASVRLRRSEKSLSEHALIYDTARSPMTNFESGITVLEVFLHTKELRTFIESLANICFPRFADLALSREDLTAETELKFQNFPKGADLLSYLYVQLRDADPAHLELLKFLFLGACEPYCAFIKSWIYRACIDDPYKEFFVYNLAKSSKAESVGDLSIINNKEQDEIIVPCFLREARVPLFRAGKQLQVLVKLLNLSNLAFIGGRADMTCNLANLDEVLPFWVPSDTRCLLNSLSFSKQRLEILMHQRQTMYNMTLEKLQLLFKKLNDRPKHLDHSVTYFGNRSSFFGKCLDPSIPLSLDSKRHLFSETSNKQEPTKIQKDAEASLTSEEVSYDDEPYQTSEYSSSYSSDDKDESQKLHFLSENLSQAQLPAISSLTSWCGNKTLLPYHTEKSIVNSAVPYYASYKQSLPMTPTEQNNMDQNLGTNSIPDSSGDIAIFPLATGDNYKSDYCWPIEGQKRNPFNSIDFFKGLKQQHLTHNEISSSGESSEFLEKAKSLSAEILIPFKFNEDPISKINLMDGTSGPCFFESCQLCNFKENYNLSANPMLTRASWLSNLDNLKTRNSMSDQVSHIRDFDFTSVSNPSICFLESICSHSFCGCQLGDSLHAKSDPSALSTDKILASPVHDHRADQTATNPLCSSQDPPSRPQSNSSSILEGAAWVGSLRRFNEYVKSSLEDTGHDSSAEFEMPLDVVIDKCIVKEILLQYKYISSFTIKLLDEGFDLHGHLLALRCYHFMELADWADSFILSLRNQKWSGIEPEKRIAVIQGLLELSLQRSSCEVDHYKERLFMYVKAQNNMTVSACLTDLQLFDFISLGYRVHWPINIIVTPDALKIYAEIFNYLIQVRLAAIVLSDIWRYTKAIMCSIPHREQRKREQVKEFNVLIKLRQKISHFVSVLQHYVQSQLSDVSWCSFQYSLKHQVKDIFDLESLHMSYLTEALDTCFLSKETRAVAAIVKNVLQCALDFWHCFSVGNVDVARNESDSSNMKSYINFPKVFDIKAEFERNLKNLYLLYLKSPKHGEFSLCRFWNLLDYNEYHSTGI